METKTIYLDVLGLEGAETYGWGVIVTFPKMGLIKELGGSVTGGTLKDAFQTAAREMGRVLERVPGPIEVFVRPNLAVLQNELKIEVTYRWHSKGDAGDALSVEETRGLERASEIAEGFAQKQRVKLLRGPVATYPFAIIPASPTASF